MKIKRYIEQGKRYSLVETDNTIKRFGIASTSSGEIFAVAERMVHVEELYTRLESAPNKKL